LLKLHHVLLESLLAN